MKKAIALLLALVMVFALCACGGGDKGTADNGEKVVKIGVFEPASGDSGAGGKKEMLGMQYANQETPTVEIGGDLQGRARLLRQRFRFCEGCLGGFQARQ